MSFNIVLKKAKRAAQDLQLLKSNTKNVVLRDLRRALIKSTKKILLANARDFLRLPKNYPHSDRLRLTSDRIKGMSSSLAAVEALPDPVGNVIDRRRLKSGISIERRTVPLGVVGIIYEARPNVTVEVFSLAFKSGNSLILKGGRDAHQTNTVLVDLIHDILRKHRITTHSVNLLNAFDPMATNNLLKANGYVDVLIPRGSNRLIEFVRKNTTLPVIETGAGVCHVYIERSANLDWADRIVFNAKTRRVSVCNALDTLVIDKIIMAKLFKDLAPKLSKAGVNIYADQDSFKILSNFYSKSLLHHSNKSHYGKEFLSLAMSVKTVKNWHAGFKHIQQHTSGHSEGIITTNKKLATKFQEIIDAAAVYVNTSIAFTDGYEFGLGGEIGISTQKLHARGPMALKELTTYKWFVHSRGAVRSQ